MLAPRKTLWSTPDEVIERVIERTDPVVGGSNRNNKKDVWFALRPDDVVCDVGCGDGRVILRWAAHVSSRAAGANEGSLQDVPPHTSSSDEVLQPQAASAVASNSYPRFVGIDVDPDRIRAARDELCRLRTQGTIHVDVSVEFWCENALECASRLQHVSVYFLYLIPRGLRIVKPLLLLGGHKLEGPTDPQSASSIVRVITYMSPLDGEVPVHVDKVSVYHQPEASWPLYYYELNRLQTT
jgi:hypothetical protein